MSEVAAPGSPGGYVSECGGNKSECDGSCEGIRR